ncbi:MAG: tetratricopeptide repeat protein [Planctomycetales bacterium]|nr:tetratricopeptide repeat protein [Planctomycetales bacterium]
MKRFPAVWVGLLAAAALLALSHAAVAEDAGQEDLDAATAKKIEARSIGDLEEVIQLCESAIKKGLDEGGAEFARQLLSSTLVQRGTMLTAPIFDQARPSPQWQQLRQLALQDLNKALEIDPKLGEAHLTIAKLQALPRGDLDKAREAIDKAVEAFAENAKQKSAALTLRAQMQEDPAKRMEDLDAAVETFAGNSEALRLRGVLHIQSGDNEKGLADLQSVIEANPEDVGAHRAASEALLSMGKSDEALAMLDKAIELDEQGAAGYILRARLHAQQDHPDKAEEDLNAAIKREPRSLPALLMRAELRILAEKFELAEGDINRVLELQPSMPHAILLKAGVLGAQEKYAAAIRELELLLSLDKDNVEVRMQIATFYVADKRPSKAIEVFTAVLKDSPDYWQALRGRADAQLSLGKQGPAIKDYEAALKLKEDSDGILNNLAWVLSTSPNDKLRDGKRAVELATKACELTEFKAAHILSTLASAYAESGDFEKAREWSAKSVEIAEPDQKEQLEAELKSYQESKPWREKQEVQEKPEPERPRESDLEL